MPKILPLHIIKLPMEGEKGLVVSLDITDNRFYIVKFIIAFKIIGSGEYDYARFIPASSMFCKKQLINVI